MKTPAYLLLRDAVQHMHQRTEPKLPRQEVRDKPGARKEMGAPTHESERLQDRHSEVHGPCPPASPRASDSDPDLRMRMGHMCLWGGPWRQGHGDREGRKPSAGV